jgi:hypothetical protein
MLKIKIYGLPPGNNPDTKVWIYDEKSYGTNKAIQLYEGNPDKDGIVNCEIATKYKNREIRFLAMPDLLNHISEPLKVTPLGLFHTVKLSLDMGVCSGTEKLPFNPTELHRTSQELMRIDYRNAKHKNWLVKGVSAIATVAAAFIGWFVAGIWGLVGGCVLAILVISLGEYATGHKKGI